MHIRFAQWVLSCRNRHYSLLLCCLYPCLILFRSAYSYEYGDPCDTRNRNLQISADECPTSICKIDLWSIRKVPGSVQLDSFCNVYTVYTHGKHVFDTVTAIFNCLHGRSIQTSTHPQTAQCWPQARGSLYLGVVSCWKSFFLQMITTCLAALLVEQWVTKQVYKRSPTTFCKAFSPFCLIMLLQWLWFMPLQLWYFPVWNLFSHIFWLNDQQGPKFWNCFSFSKSIVVAKWFGM